MKATVLSRIPVVLVVLVVGAAMTWFVAKGPGKSRTRPIGSEVVSSSSTGSNRVDGDESAALRQRMTELELKVAALSAQAAARASDDTAKAQNAPTPAESEPLSLEDQIKQDRATWEDHMTEVAQNFETEARDGRWARDTASLLTAHAGGDAAMRTAIKQIECRSATCRVEMVDDQKGEFARQLPIFVQGLGSVFPMAEARTVDNADGTRTLSVYFSANGNAEPRGG
jgi:hypothetical protein